MTPHKAGYAQQGCGQPWTGRAFEIPIRRAAQYFNIGTVEVLVEFLQPFGVLANARIDGEHFANSSSAGDTTLAASVWLMNDKAARRYLGLTLYLVVPDGAYDRRETINLGGNRMVYDPELASTRASMTGGLSISRPTFSRTGTIPTRVLRHAKPHRNGRRYSCSTF